MKFLDYIKRLDVELDFAFTRKHMLGHDWAHIDDIAGMGTAIQKYLDFDLQEFLVAARLHNTDRSLHLMNNRITHSDWKEYLHGLLANSPFDSEARYRIVDASMRHNQRDIQQGDSNLLIALMDADKLVRFRPSNLVYAGAYGVMLGIPCFDRKKPFGFQGTAEADRTSIWIAFMAVLKWVGMLSCDEARKLIDPEYLKLLISFLRLLGREMADFAGVPNTSEQDIKNALGDYYRWTMDKFLPCHIQLSLLK